MLQIEQGQQIALLQTDLLLWTIQESYKIVLYTLYIFKVSFHLIDTVVDMITHKINSIV